MLARRLKDVNNLSLAADDVSVLMAYEPYAAESGYRFRLKPKTDGKRYPWKRFPYWRTSTGYTTRGRTVCAVCWHGHRDFYRALFHREPDARIYTALLRHKDVSHLKMRYWSKENFEDNFEETAAINAGPPVAPLAVSEACYCHVNGAWSIPQSMLTGECWLVQMSGFSACKTCDAFNTSECGGQEIRSTGQNALGFPMPLRPGVQAMFGPRPRVMEEEVTDG